jgi:DnaJ-class molecular chaperone
MNYYDILEIDYNSSQDQIKKSFRKLSLKYHPDKNNNNTKKYNSILDAYQTLSNEMKKKIYDHTIKKNNKNDNNVMILQNNDLHNSNNISKDIDILNIDLELLLTDIYENKNIPIKIKRNNIIFKNNIEYKEIEEETLYIDVISGIDNNEIITIYKKGHSYNKKYGDIKIYIKIINNTVFDRTGLDLIYKKDITLKQALCGFEFYIEHINGTKYKINNNEIINLNTEKKIPNLGIKRNNCTGILIIKFNIIFPIVIDKSIIQQLNDIDF